MTRNRVDLGQTEVLFLPHGKRSVLKRRITLLGIARALGIDLTSLCNGMGTCGKCKIKIEKGIENLGSLTELELKHLTEKEIKDNFRLACQVKPTSPVVVYVPERSRMGKQRLQTEGLEVPVKKLNPFVKKYFVELPKPTLKDSRADEDRLLVTLNEKHGISPDLKLDMEISRDLANVLRRKDWKITATVWKDQIIDIQSGNVVDRCFGFAADVGTTKLAGFLMDLNSGEVVAVSARMNPQIPFGEEVMSRITYQMMNGWEGVKALQKAVVSGINEMIEECCEQAKVSPNEIYELCFVGNTAMQLCFLGIYGQSVAFSPYPPVLRRGVDVKGRSLGLKCNERANSYFAPIIGGFVGSDNVAVILATRMLESDEIVLALDIGTNTEIDLGNKDLIRVASCASGPAFEGMSIRHGMRAASGSIERVSIDNDSLDVYYRTIDNQPAIGLCGSALVDIPAELLKAGFIDWSGRFIPEMSTRTNRLRKDPSGIWEFVIAWQPNTAIETDITITQGDIREIQKAKAAMRAGAGLLMKRMGINTDEIDKLYLAGAFGNYIDPENARIIGMYPEMHLDKVEFVGNIAGTGSRMCLISKEEREYAEKISKIAEYYELAADKYFQTEYIHAMYFPHKDLERYPDTVDLLRKLGREPR